MFLVGYYLSHYFECKNRWHKHRDLSKQVEDFITYFRPQLDWTAMVTFMVFFPIAIVLSVECLIEDRGKNPAQWEVEETWVVLGCLGCSGLVNLCRLILKPIIYLLTVKDTANTFERKKRGKRKLRATDEYTLSNRYVPTH